MCRGRGNGLEGGGSTLDLALEAAVPPSTAGCHEHLGEGWAAVKRVTTLGPTLRDSAGFPAQ